MKYEWDPHKNQLNLQNHKLDFADALLIFEQPMLVKLDERQDYGEDRWIGIGLLHLRVVVIIFTEPRPDTIRIISLRKATSYEQRQYEKAYRNEFGRA
jgi:uncharacterized DUF497 family protein